MKSKIIQGIIVIVLALVVSFAHPLNAKTNLLNSYLVVPVDTIIKLEDVKQIYSNKLWVCLPCIKDMINLDNNRSSQLALQYKIYIRTKQVILTEPRFIDVMFIEEFGGFWIFKII